MEVGGVNILDSLLLTCPACKEKTAIDKEHAKKHGYTTLAAFRRAYNIESITMLQRSRNKFKELYNIDYSRWVVGYKAGAEMRYVMKQYVEDYTEAKRLGLRSANKMPLSDSNFNAHLRGKNPLAIFAYGTHARFFGFDVDTKEQAAVDTFKLVNTLVAEGIPREHIHVSFSGGKGYHIEVFTDKHITHTDWTMFGRYIRDKAGLTGAAIEFRPTKTNGHAWKLPLTFHPKTGKFAGYCDKDTLRVMNAQESHDYLFAIQQMDASLVFPIIQRARQHEKHILANEEAEKAKQREKRKAVVIREVRLFKTKDEKHDTAVKLLREGLPGKGTRWKAMRNVLIPFLKCEQGLDAEETREQLIEWTKREIGRGKVSTPLKECIAEIDDLIENYFPQVDGFYSVVRDIEITRGEIEWVISTIKKGGRKHTRDVLWALLLLKKAYANKAGEFFASLETIQKLLSVPRKISEPTIIKHRNWLSEKGYIMYSVPQNSFAERKATNYKITYVEESKPEIIDSVTFDEGADGRALLLQIAEKLYTPEQLKLLAF